MTEACRQKLWPQFQEIAGEDGYSQSTIERKGGSVDLYPWIGINTDGTQVFQGRYTISNGYSNYYDYFMTGTADCEILSVERIYL